MPLNRHYECRAILEFSICNRLRRCQLMCSCVRTLCLNFNFFLHFNYTKFDSFYTPKFGFFLSRATNFFKKIYSFELFFLIFFSIFFSFSLVKSFFVWWTHKNVFFNPFNLVVFEVLDWFLLFQFYFSPRKNRKNKENSQNNFSTQFSFIRQNFFLFSLFSSTILLPLCVRSHAESSAIWFGNFLTSFTL